MKLPPGPAGSRGALVALAVVLLATCGLLGLLEPTETRYAEIAREMTVTGDYLVPRLDGITHFQKPPLTYWITAASFAVFSHNEWGARIPATLAALVTLACLGRVAKRRFASLASPGTAETAVWILGSSLLFLGPGRSVSCDPYLTASVAGFWALAPSPAALAVLGLGFLAKGPVVLVPTLLPVLVLALAQGLRRRGARPPGPPALSAIALLGPAWGWGIFAAVGFPWYLIVSARTPGLLSYFLGNQTWQRYTTEIHHRPGAWWYFLAVLVAGLLPWTPALLPGLRALWKDRAKTEARLLLAWLVVPLLFFSLSGSKLPAYLLPSMPAAALIAAIGLTREGVRPRWMTPGRAAAVALGTVGVVALSTAGTIFFEDRLGAPRRLAERLAAERESAEPVVEYRRFCGGLPFYLHEPVYLLEVPREMRFEEEEGSSTILDEAGLRALAARNPRVWIYGPEEPGRALASRLGLSYQVRIHGKRASLAVLSHLTAQSENAGVSSGQPL